MGSSERTVGKRGAASLTLFYLIEVEELVDFYFYILRAGP